MPVRVQKARRILQKLLEEWVVHFGLKVRRTSILQLVQKWEQAELQIVSENVMTRGLPGSVRTEDPA